MALRELFEKSAAADLLREMIGFAAERLMELDAGKPTRAGHGQRSPQRLVQGNGYQTPSAYAARLTATHAHQIDQISRFPSSLSTKASESRLTILAVVPHGVVYESPRAIMG